MVMNVRACVVGDAVVGDGTQLYVYIYMYRYVL